jgi:hypothetical protein
VTLIDPLHLPATYKHTNIQTFKQTEVIPVGLRRNKDLRFIQLYTSPEFEPYRPSLVAPSEVPGHDADTEKHLFSPLVSVCENAGLVN